MFTIDLSSTASLVYATLIFILTLILIAASFWAVDQLPWTDVMKRYGFILCGLLVAALAASVTRTATTIPVIYYLVAIAIETGIALRKRKNR